MFLKFPEIPKFREIRENVGKFSPGKFREIFPRIFLYFQGMKHILQPYFCFLKKVKSRKFREISGGNFREIPGNFSRKRREIFSEFFCVFLIETYVTALILFFKNVQMHEISENFGGKFQENVRKFRRRKISGENFPGKFPPDFPAFSGDETHVTALILSFEKLKIGEISRNFGRKFPGNSRKFSPKTSGNFPRIFLRFFLWKRMLQP
jgi:hypothetical protein